MLTREWYDNNDFSAIEDRWWNAKSTFSEVTNEGEGRQRIMYRSE